MSRNKARTSNNGGVPGIVKTVRSAGQPRLPEVVRVQAMSGDVASTAFIRDMDRGMSPLLYVFPTYDVNFRFMTNPGTFPPLDATIGGTIETLYNTMITKYQAVSGKTWRWPRLTSPTALARWLSLYGRATMRTRFLQALVNGPQDSYISQDIARIANYHVVNAIDAAADAMKRTAAPQGLFDMIDFATGYKGLSTEEPYILYGFIPVQVENELTNQIPDLRTEDYLFALCLACQQDFNMLTGNAPGEDADLDFYNIHTFFGQVFGFPTIPIKEVEMDPGAYGMFLNSPVVRKTATLDEVPVVSYHAYPGLLGEPTPSIHIQIMRGASEKAIRYILSLVSHTGWAIGPSPLPEDQNVIALFQNFIPNATVGLGEDANPYASTMAVYNQQGDFLIQDVTGSEDSSFEYTNHLGRYWRNATAVVESADQWNSDRDPYFGINDYVIATGSVSKSTEVWLYKTFVDEMNVR